MLTNAHTYSHMHDTVIRKTFIVRFVEVTKIFYAKIVYLIIIANTWHVLEVDKILLHEYF